MGTAGTPPLPVPSVRVPAGPTASRAFVVATCTTSDAGAAVCRRAWASAPMSVARPARSHRVPATASNTADRSPTAATCTDLSFSPVPYVGSANPWPRAASRTRLPPVDTAVTDPSTPTDRAAAWSADAPGAGSPTLALGSLVPSTSARSTDATVSS